MSREVYASGLSATQANLVPALCVEALMVDVKLGEVVSVDLKTRTAETAYERTFAEQGKAINDKVRCGFMQKLVPH